MNFFVRSKCLYYLIPSYPVTISPLRKNKAILSRLDMSCRTQDTRDDAK